MMRLTSNTRPGAQVALPLLAAAGMVALLLAFSLGGQAEAATDPLQRIADDLEHIAKDMEEIHEDMHKVAFALRLTSYASVASAALLACLVLAVWFRRN